MSLRRQVRIGAFPRPFYSVTEDGHHDISGFMDHALHSAAAHTLLVRLPDGASIHADRVAETPRMDGPGSVDTKEELYCYAIGDPAVLHVTANNIRQVTEQYPSATCVRRVGSASVLSEVGP